VVDRRAACGHDGSTRLQSRSLQVKIKITFQEFEITSGEDQLTFQEFKITSGEDQDHFLCNQAHLG
jgi:hypothetical protein